MFGLRNTSKRNRRLPRSRDRFVELLEGRTLLSGNVITTPTGTPNSPGQPAPMLNIQGDALGNEIMIRKGGTPDEIIVNGLNGTLVNGSTQEWHFSGVRQLDAFMDSGDDVVKLTDLKLSARPGPVGDPFEGVALFDVEIDGGIGDDRLTVTNTTFNAKADPSSNSQVGMILSGDVTTSSTGSSTGNDWIDVSNTTLIADGGQVSAGILQIFGEQNAGGTVTSGNDHINLSNTVLRASNSSFGGTAFAAIQIYGDFNTAGSGQTSVIGQGNDWIDVNGTSIIADSAQGSAIVVVEVYGDSNSSDPGGTATIGNFAARTGGNDTISLTNTTISARAANFSNNSVAVDIRGDQNFSNGGVADVGGGNDNISVKNFAAGATGFNSTNETDLRIFADGDLIASPSVTSRIGVGNDVISLTNDDVFAAGNAGNVANVTFYSDDRTQSGETASTVGQGDDNVQISNFRLQASASATLQLQTQKGKDVVDIFNSRVGNLVVSTGGGDDDLEILNSNWGNGNLALDDGNDLLKMNGDSFTLTTADGGPGIDTLDAHNNSGVLLTSGFEIVK